MEGSRAEVLDNSSGTCEDEEERNGNGYSCDLSEAESEGQCQVGALQKEDILYEVFKHLDSNSLLQCRLVCSLWNSSIINDPELMRRIEVSIGDCEEFLKSTITLKARNFQFHEATIFESKQKLETFVDKISLSAEIVAIGFHGLWQKHQHTIDQLFTFVLSKCVNLKSLRFNSPNELLRSLSEELVSKAVITNVEELVLNSYTLWKPGVVSNLKLLLLKLPKLRFIQFQCEKYPITGRPGMQDMTLLDTFLEHMKLYPGALMKLSFCRLISNDYGTEYPTKVWEFVLTAGKQKLIVDSVDIIHFNELAEYLSKINQTRLTEEHCRLVKYGICVIAGEEMESSIESRLLRLCTNLAYLRLTFVRCPVPGDLYFLEYLKKLDRLLLANFDLDWKEGIVGIEVFPQQLPSIKHLEIQVPLFNTIAYQSFYTVFPSMTDLDLRWLNNLPEDILSWLAKMEHLTSLSIERCNLTDSMVSLPCEIQRGDDFEEKQREQLLLVSAISTFQCLKTLNIICCPHLTDSFLVYGVAKSRTLEKLLLLPMKEQFSSDALNAVVEAGRLSRLPRDAFWDGGSIRFALQ